MNYEESLKYINECSRFSINLGLERTEKMLELLGNPEKKIKYIHIAGTNGKGSTSAMISQILMEEGYKTGLYTSPFVQQFGERIQINRENITEKEVAELITRVSKVVEQLIVLGYEPPTQFEIVTVAAFLYFYEKNVDFVVLEVGLGGRLDATNVIIPILTIITSISFDHMDILGDTLEKIAYEKAGIIKDNVPVVIYPQDRSVYRVIEKIATDKKCDVTYADRGEVSFSKVFIEDDFIGQEIEVNTRTKEYTVKLSLLGKHQLMNCLTAVTGIEALIKTGVAISEKSIIDGLSKVKWMARLEVLNKNPLVVIDGAHNNDGIAMLVKSIKEYFEYDKLILILGILADKEVEKMAGLISKKADKVICITPHSERAELAEDLKELVEKYNKNCLSIDDYSEAYEEALNSCGENDLLLISGSFYMVGDMRRIVMGE
ncbi:bifunctional folylpolyglutamate synthase/dihydrofolate synthase [Clostridium grantii]|uniref:Dihydrofolate synthase/folylpolyglutamate synthase n=1 Tax=Clostridium grantii DSM 8605 TaxID=1121316 RepID=A0A1M5VUJ7_9CLOT|nr:folylpolyglutamate synthase/dihydrofolate synthase family protein [Clostridium grantii]SHH78877.1 dihydrofolate synthase / folylpolyglutamate synthase [Clostridium grantii DSM 8605]